MGSDVTNAGRWTATGRTSNSDAVSMVSPAGSQEAVTRWVPSPASPGTDSPLLKMRPAAVVVVGAATVVDGATVTRVVGGMVTPGWGRVSRVVVGPDGVVTPPAGRR